MGSCFKHRICFWVRLVVLPILWALGTCSQLCCSLQEERGRWLLSQISFVPLLCNQQGLNELLQSLHRVTPSITSQIPVTHILEKENQGIEEAEEDIRGGRVFLLGFSPWFEPEDVKLPTPARKQMWSLLELQHIFHWSSFLDGKLLFLAKIKGFQGKLLGHSNFPLGNLKWLLPTRKLCEVKVASGCWQTKRELLFWFPCRWRILWKALLTNFPC